MVHDPSREEAQRKTDRGIEDGRRRHASMPKSDALTRVKIFAESLSQKPDHKPTSPAGPLSPTPLNPSI
jgi:hypothetical protein